MKPGFTRISAVLGIVVLVFAGASPIPAREFGAAALDQALRDLSSDLRVACLAAHPDDEDGETLALLRRKAGVETTAVFFTRGEGGQNDLGPELYAELGAIRTRETRAACAEIGVRARFLEFLDFGYSRSADETFFRWGREETVFQLVRALREIRPHVVITNHATEGGHGHHQAVGIAAIEAFDVAADPERYPEAGEPWAVSKLYVACSPEDATALPNTGEVDPIRGISYAEQGLRSLKLHRSQGTWDWVDILPGPRYRPYRLERSRLEDAGSSLLAGLSVPRPGWLTEGRLTGTREAILKRILEHDGAPAEERPSASKVSKAIGAALGVEIFAEVEGGSLAVGGEGVLAVRLLNGGRRPVFLKKLAVTVSGGIQAGPAVKRPDRLGPGEAWTGRFSLSVGAEVEPNRPLAAHLSEEAEARFRIEVRADVAIEGRKTPISFSRVVPVEVFPPISLSIEPWGRLLRPAVGWGRAFVIATNHSSESIEAKLVVEVLGTSQVKAEAKETVRVAPGDSVTIPIQLRSEERVAEGLFGVRVELAGEVAEDILRVMDVEVPIDVRIAIVQTLGEEEYRSLAAMGMLTKRLTDLNLQAGWLSEDYDVIVLGIRPYFSRPILRRVNRRLLEFVEQGGVLIVNYNKEREWSPDYAPLELRIGRARVTDENAPIVIDDPDHTLLHFPNEIGDDDFDGWVQERGLYFPSEWDQEAFDVIFKTSDPTEPFVPGILLGRYGKGVYIYTSMSWYRQLRNLNPAALKILGNMVSYLWRR